MLDNKKSKQSLFCNSETGSLSSLKSIEYGLLNSSKISPNIPHTRLFIFVLYCVKPRDLFYIYKDHSNFNHEFVNIYLLNFYYFQHYFKFQSMFKRCCDLLCDHNNNDN